MFLVFCDLLFLNILFVAFNLIADDILFFLDNLFDIWSMEIFLYLSSKIFLRSKIARNKGVVKNIIFAFLSKIFLINLLENFQSGFKLIQFYIDPVKREIPFVLFLKKYIDLTIKFTLKSIFYFLIQNLDKFIISMRNNQRLLLYQCNPNDSGTMRHPFKSKINQILSLLIREFS